MKWIECIKVQAAGDQGQTATPKLLELIAEIKQCPRLLEADVYDRASAYGDFAVLLIWDTEQPQNEGSREGLHLKQLLNHFGLVNHSVWTIKG